jgi:F0F1-type ATP synthase membrane subunit b/b'
MSDETVVQGGTPGWLTAALAVLGLLAVAGVGFGWTAMSHNQDTRQALSTELKTVKQGVDKDLQQLQTRQAETEKAGAELQGDLNVVTKRLRITQGELKRARAEAADIREENAKQLAAMDTSVKGELATKASTDAVNAVSGEVTVVKSDLATTRNDLQMARGEMGTLIARNHEEVEQLRRMGERDYIEFTADGKGKPVKVGNVTVELRGTNPGRYQFTLALIVEDKRVEKRNRTINEPIYFYTHGARQPLELVVNQVSKNKVVGYLSVPKASQAATSGN